MTLALINSALIEIGEAEGKIFEAQKRIEGKYTDAFKLLPNYNSHYSTYEGCWITREEDEVCFVFKDWDNESRSYYLPMHVIEAPDPVQAMKEHLEKLNAEKLETKRRSLQLQIERAQAKLKELE